MANEETLKVVDYIDRFEVLAILGKKIEFYAEPPVDKAQLELLYELRTRIKDISSRDVEEVRHGEWVIDNSIKERSFYEVNYKVLITCSICGSRHFLGLQQYPIFSQKELKNDAYRKYRYCGECGAKMDGGKEE